MSEFQSLGDAAKQFVDLLTPGNFSFAEEWISRDCEYVYGGNTLRGKSIIQSFIDNHGQAAQKLDRIEYQDGKVEKIEGRSVSVLITDRIWVGSQSHDYYDRLIVTFGPQMGPGSVIHLENRRVDGERERLLQFFKSCGIEWK